MGFDLWDRFTGNLIADFDTEAEALEFVRAELRAAGPGVVDRMALTRVTNKGHVTTVVAEGAGLLALVQTTAS